MRPRPGQLLPSALLAIAACGCGGPEDLEFPGTPEEEEPAAATDVCPDPPDAGVCENRVIMDIGADGVADKTSILSFDDLGQPIHYAEVDIHGCMTYEVDRVFDHGRLARQTYSGADTYPHTVVIGYDADGTASSLTGHDPRTGASGTYRWSLDAQGRMWKRTWDHEDDGEIDAVEDVTYGDGDPMIVRDAFDDGADGTIDFETRWAYLDGRSLLRFETVSEGVSEQTTSVTYDGGAPGALSRVQSVSPDGTVFFVTTISRSGGRVSHVDYDVGGDGTIEQTSDVEYDADGRTIKNVYTSNGFYSDRAYTYTWGPAGIESVLEEDHKSGWVAAYHYERGCDVPEPFPIHRCPNVCALAAMDPLDGYLLDFNVRNTAAKRIDWIE